MASTDDSLRSKLRLDAFPRSSHYDLEWMLETEMGPNVLWLADSLSQVLDLRPDMRVLDMGCGKAASSIFLAKEFSVSVWATDLWISADEKWWSHHWQKSGHVEIVQADFLPEGWKHWLQWQQLLIEKGLLLLCRL